MEQLAAKLRREAALLVLDNCEHLIPVCAMVADHLLDACPDLRILVTSRESLNRPGQRVFRVQPLAVRADGAVLTRSDIASYEAVELLIDLARHVAPHFTFTCDDARAIAELCRRLDGVPLALELAATRMRVLTPLQILEPLDQRFARLFRGMRGVPETPTDAARLPRPS